MKSLRSVHPCALACLVALSSATLVPAADRSPVEASIADAARDGRYSFVLFHSRRDSATKAAYGTVKTEAERFNGQVLPIDVADGRESALIERFDATRMPMPTVVALAPNGAVTGVFPLKVTAEQIRGAFASPGNADCIRGLQTGKLVLLCVHPGSVGDAPRGVRQFAADPHFEKRTEVLHVSADDPREADFMRRLRITSDIDAPRVVFMAPPGVMVGKFKDNVTMSILAGKLAEAGKCCEDPNCKHHKR